MKITALLLAFYMLIGGLIPRTDFSQLVYMVDLRAHYLEHQADAALQNKSLSVLDFLYTHYINNNIDNDVDHEEDHHQLPCQNINSSATFLLAALLLPDFPIIDSLFSSNLSYQSPFYLSGFLSTTVRPPSCY